MRGFVKLFFLIILFGFVSIVLYFGYQKYQLFNAAKESVQTLVAINSDYRQLKSYVPSRTSETQPLAKIDEKLGIVYSSPLSPCVSLINDRNWQIYASSRRIFQDDDQLMLYDRFWNVVWLGLKPKYSEIVDFRFYGPFRLEDVPERSFIEYLLIGRDVTPTDGSFKISLPGGECE